MKEYPPSCDRCGATKQLVSKGRSLEFQCPDCGFLDKLIKKLKP